MCRRIRRIFVCILLIMVLTAVAATASLFAGRAQLLLAFLHETDVIWNQPDAFGAFHLAWLFFCIGFAVLFGILGAKKGRQWTDQIVFFAWILLFWLEVYKQLYSAFVLYPTTYNFGIFPFQFCSLPLYLYPLVLYLPEGRAKETLYQFIGLFGTMGGCIVMGYPVFYDRLSLCIHTMLWHTVMIAIGCFVLFSRGYGRKRRREVPPAALLFLLFFGTATLLNVVLTPLAVHSPNPLNLFYMSPYEQSHYILIGDVQRVGGWFLAWLTYAVLFIFVGATTVFGAVWGIRKMILLFFAKKRMKIKKKFENPIAFLKQV